MSVVIDARVFQKTDTLANWMNNPLILGKGEQAFVQSDIDDNAIIYKVGNGLLTFAQLPYPDFTVRDVADTETVWSGKPSGIYLPTEDGVYGGINVLLSDGYNILFWDGETLFGYVIPIDLSGYATHDEVSATTPLVVTPFTNGSYVNAHTGTLGASDSYQYSPFIAVTPGDAILINTRCGGILSVQPPAGIAGYSSATEGSFVSTIDGDGLPAGEIYSKDRYAKITGTVADNSRLTVTAFRVVIPAGVNFIRGCSAYTDGVVLSIQSQKTAAKAITDLNTRVSLLETKTADVTGDFVVDVTGTLTNGMYVNSNTGALSSSAAYHYSSLIPVSPGDKITVTLRCGGMIGGANPPSGIAGYASNSRASFVSTLDVHSLPIGTIWSNDRAAAISGTTAVNSRVTYEDIQITIPAGVNFISGCSAYTDTINLNILKNTTTATITKAVQGLIDSESDVKPSLIPSPGVEIVSHRGLNAMAPENSVDAFIYSARAGYKYVELDFTTTLDNQLVVLHDDGLTRTFRNASGYTVISPDVIPNNTNLADLRANYVLISPKDRFRMPIPLLSEVLEVCRQYGLFPLIEIKTSTAVPNNNPISTVHVEAAYHMAVQFLGRGNFAMTSFDTALCDFAKSLDPELQVNYSTVMSIDSLVKKGGTAEFEYSALTKAQVDEAKAKDVKVYPYTVPASKYDAMVKMGVDSILSNELAPNLINQEVIFKDYSDELFSSYSTTGTIDTSVGIATLPSTKNLLWDFGAVVPFGGLYVSFQAKGVGSVTLPKLTTDLSSTEWVTYTFQPLLTGETPGLVITGGVSGIYIRDIKIKIARF